MWICGKKIKNNQDVIELMKEAKHRRYTRIFSLRRLLLNKEKTMIISRGTVVTVLDFGLSLGRQAGLSPADNHPH